MENEGNKEMLYQLKPNFNFIYEMFMPSGKKMKNSFMSALVLLIIEIILLIFRKYIVESMESSINLEVINLTYDVLLIGILVLILIMVIIFTFRMLFQMLEYKGMNYTFFDDHMIYENNFLNQTRKTVEYSSVKEVEIRRNIFDRIMNYGIIVIYTNAEKEYGSAIVIYSLKDTQIHYEKVDSIIRKLNKSVES